MTVAIRCRCGTLQGHVEPQQAYARAACYCRDCQAFARFLGREAEVLDANGGTDIVATLPASLRFTSGLDQLACMSLSPKGVLRWYAACCRSPIANTPRDPGIAYVGVVGDCLAAERGEKDAAFGPLRIALNAKSALGEVASTPLASFAGVLRIMRGLLGARLRGRHRDNPFFDPGSGEPVRTPHVLDKAARAAVDPTRAS